MKINLLVIFFLFFAISSCKKDCYLCKADCVRIYTGVGWNIGYCDFDFEIYDKYIEFADSVVGNSDTLAYKFFTNNVSFCDDDEKLERLLDRGMRCEKN